VAIGHGRFIEPTRHLRAASIIGLVVRNSHPPRSNFQCFGCKFGLPGVVVSILRRMLSVVQRVRDLARLREISAVLVRHGFGEIVTRAGLGRTSGPTSGSRPPPADDLPVVSDEHLEAGEAIKTKVSTAERVRLAIQDLGPSFIKLGQIASTRPDLIPADVITELKKLQDNVPPVPYEEIKKQVETSLGATIESTFLRFDPIPLATASIGQVHRARIATDDGEREVVVKVQRPGVGDTVLRDLELLHLLASTVEKALPETKVYSPVGLVEQFDRSITAELNFTIEAENGARLAQNFAGNNHVRFPIGYKQSSSKRVLTLEFFDGKKIDAALKAGANGPLLAKRSVGLVIKMIFEDGFFHADPHPGNIIILGTHEEPVVGLIDLGMVGRLSPELRDRTVDLMIAAARKDSYAVADALYAIGRPTRKVEMREYRSEVALLAEKYLGRPLKEIELSAMIRDLVQGAMKYGLEIPPDFMLVGKALMTIEGIGKQLDPDLDVFSEASPYFLNIMKQRYSPERLTNELWRGVEHLSRVGYDVPTQLREVLDDIRLGRLSIKYENDALNRATENMGKRVFAGVAFAGLLLSASYLLAQHNIIAGIILYVLAGLVYMRDIRRS
jgi:ubiquinone biosynthesis protein